MSDPNMGEQTAEAPATDVPQSESAEQVVDQPQATVPESPESDTGKNEVGEIPKDNAAWAQMRTENKRLKEALETVDPSYLESLRAANQPASYQAPQVDPINGDADYTQVTQRVNWTQDQAVRANQQVARLQQQIELQQDREAERAYPELRTDKVFQQIVAEKKLAARVLGHDRTTLEIADEVNRLLARREEQVVAKTAQETKQQIGERQVISSEPRGRTSGGQSALSNDDLRRKVRKGDTEAQTEVARGLIADLEF